MKALLTIFISVICFSGISQNRFVSSINGDDSQNGLTSGTAWATLEKAATVTYSAGNSILLERGSVFHGVLRLPSSSVIIQNYGTGDPAVIEGRESISSWTSLGGNIYSKVVTAATPLRMVTVDGTIARLAREPNFSAPSQGWIPSTATGNNNTQGQTNTITSSVTPPSWLNDSNQVVIRKKDYAISICDVVSVAGNVVSYTNPETLSTNVGNGLFYQNSFFALDQNNEYYYDGTTLYLYSTTNPNSKNVMYAARDTGIVIGGRSNIVVDGIEVRGQNQIGISSFFATNPIVRNSFASYCGIVSIQLWQSAGAVVDNCIVHDNLSSGIFERGDGSGGVSGQTVTNNIVYNTGLYPGMSLSGVREPQAGIVAKAGSNLSVKYNRVTNNGYIGIAWYCVNTGAVKYNWVDSSMQYIQDGGSIYAFNVSTNSGYRASIPQWSNDTVANNFMLHSIGNYFGTTTAQLKGRNGYNDEGVNHVLSDSNTSAFAADYGYYNNSNTNLTFTNNISFRDSGALSFNRFRNMPTPITNIVANNCVYYPYRFNFFDNALDSPSAQSLQTRVSNLSIDNNFYFNSTIAQMGVGGKNFTNVVPTGYTYTNYNFQNWQSQFGEDLNSTQTANNGDSIRLVTNYTNATVTVSLGAVYRDAVTGVEDTDVTIPPYYSSVLIFVGASPTPPPTDDNKLFWKPLKQGN